MQFLWEQSSAVNDSFHPAVLRIYYYDFIRSIDICPNPAIDIFKFIEPHDGPVFMFDIHPALKRELLIHEIQYRRTFRCDQLLSVSSYTPALAGIGPSRLVFQ